jgi:hypothetical protein
MYVRKSISSNVSCQKKLAYNYKKIHHLIHTEIDKQLRIIGPFPSWTFSI